MAIQRAINDNVFSKVQMPASVFGVRGRGVRDNVMAHVGHTYVYVRDIREAFPSVTARRVKTALQAIGFDDHAAGLITRLCTAANQLPQGAPTSNALLNIVLAPLDRTIEARAVEFGARYTRYVDDITISAAQPVAEFLETVERWLTDFGFTVNQRKRRHWGPGSRAVITGVVLAGSPRPKREFLRELSREVRNVARGRPTSLSSTQIRGRVAWAKYLDAELGRGFDLEIALGARNRQAAERRVRKARHARQRV